MSFNITLTEKCKNIDFPDDYEEFREHEKSNTPAEDEMLRYFLTCA